MTRRQWLLAGGAVLFAGSVWRARAQEQAVRATPAKDAPTLAIEWVKGAIPDAFLREAVVFTRAYTACPEPVAAQWALEHGRFPHAERPEDASVWDFFRRTPADVADIVVMTTYSADGIEWWSEHSVHVPLAIRWRDQWAPHVTGVLCSHVDVLPTLLHAAGMMTPAAVQGRTLITGFEEARTGPGTRDEPLHSVFSTPRAGAQAPASVALPGAAAPLGQSGAGAVNSGQTGAATMTAAGVRGRVPAFVSSDAVYIEGGLGDTGFAQRSNGLEEWRAVIRGYDKLVWTIGAHDQERIVGLYNVAEDPGESTDLQDVGGSRLMRDSLKALGEAWMQRLEDGRDARGFRTRKRA